MGAGDKMKGRVTSFILFFILSAFLVIAPCPPDCNGDGTVANTPDWNSPAYLEQNFLDNPLEALKQNPADAWDYLNNNPDALSDLKVLDAAFDPINIDQTMAEINSNPKFLEGAEVLNRFDKEVQGNGVHYLNENSDAKVAWFKEKHKIIDEGATVSSYDGTLVSAVPAENVLNTINQKIGQLKQRIAESEKFASETIGTSDHDFYLRVITGLKVDLEAEERKSNPLTFTAKDFPEARLTDKGTLILDKEELEFGSSSSLSIKIDSKGNKIFVMEGGKATVFGKEELSLSVKGGQVEIGSSFAQYTGDFTFRQDFGGVTASGNFKYKDEETYNIEGTIFRPSVAHEGEFIIISDSKLSREDGTIIDIKLRNAMMVYFAGSKSDKGRSGATFCDNNHPCIVDSVGEKGDLAYRTRLAFINFDGVDVSVTTPAYYSHVEVMDLKDGHVTFISTTPKGRVNSQIDVGPQDDIQFKGRLASTNVGRFDVMYENDAGEEILHHWSSNQKQKDSDYFTKPRNKFVSCNVDSDCEEIFAKNFGKIILPQDRTKKPKTTIIAGGDNAFTAQEQEKLCRKNGCYILNSRDVPPKTQTEELIVTGHHWYGTNYVWRDPPEAEHHNPIDNFYFSQSAFASPFDSVPEGDNVKRVKFSACNTVIDEVYIDSQTQDATPYLVLEELQSQYPNLETVQGWNGIAPYKERVGNSVESLADIQLQDNPDYKEGGVKGNRAWYFKDSNGVWQYTQDGQECTSMVNNKITNCNAVLS